MNSIEMQSGSYTLRFSEMEKGFGLCVLHNEKTTFANERPCRLFLKKPTAVPEEIRVSYSQVEETNDSVTALAEVETDGGGIIRFTDVFQTAEKDLHIILSIHMVSVLFGNINRCQNFFAY